MKTNNQDLINFHQQINEKCESEIQQSITNELFRICGSWRMYFDEPIYIIGLSEDKYDFYYIGINNKERKLKFITCLYKLEACRIISKKWSTDEKQLITNYVNTYFDEHKNEKLLYLEI